MRPSTVHFVAQVIRHGRGLCTAVEKWIKATPSGELATESGRLIEFARRAFTAAERELGTPRSNSDRAA